MGFSTKQLQALRRNIDECHIRTRESNGKQLSYIEGWYAIGEANRIFGFDGWSRETVESKCVLARENRGNFLAVYTAKVRVTVYTEATTPIIREGHGTGEGRGGTPGEVHDIAIKAAETDATKRALATFGRPFGLELYRGRKDAVRRSERPEGPSIIPTSEPPSAPDKVRHADRGRTGVSPPDYRNDRASGPETKDHRAADPTPHIPSTRPDERRQEKQATSPGRKQIEQGRLPHDEAPSLHSPPLPPDDTSPIPRPSRHYGRREYLASRERTGILMNELARRAEASLAPAEQFTPEKIDKSVLTFGEPKRLRDKAHLRFVASQPCLICGRQPADAHHLRFAQLRALGRKVSDEFTVPLCRGHHREVHQTGNEPAFWEDLDINALEIAKGLWEQSRPNNQK